MINNKVFKSEKDFEEQVVKLLRRNGWEIKNKVFSNDKTVLEYQTEEDLTENWREIIYLNNMGKNELNNVRLNDDEMNQILDKVNDLRGNPVEINEFITTGRVSIKRSNPLDTLHEPKHQEISLTLFDKESINSNTIYQIARQPILNKVDDVGRERRGDLMLLINGMPLIHLELKNGNVSVTEAESQLEKYIAEGKYRRGIFSLIQVFIAMTPSSTIYWANPGPNNVDDNRTFHFHWADDDNNIIDEYTAVVERFLNIPTAHHLIGYYTIADRGDGNLKVMRSYQVHAVEAICNSVTKASKDWDANHRNLGGYIWHTTGSGKTMTSIKAAERISELRQGKDYLIDKVIFLMDRIELTTQSFLEYKNLIGAGESVTDTDNTGDLQNKFLSNNPNDKLIVTSIQKMNILAKSIMDGENTAAGRMQKLKSVFIIDECHRSTFGEMLSNTKKAFPNAIFFGFTGTPIFDKNAKTKGNIQVENHNQTLTTLDLFGNRLHEYNLSHGIRDKNVLGFDVAPVYVYEPSELAEKVALRECGVQEYVELDDNPVLLAKYNEIKKRPQSKTYVIKNEDGEEEVKHNGIERYVSKKHYNCDKSRRQVIKNIKKNWDSVSSNGYFHALLATSSIKEAIEYYKLFREIREEFPIKVTALFDPSEDPSGAEGTYKANIYKNAAIKQMLDDYNDTFATNFVPENYDEFKKNVSSRLAHKGIYTDIGKDDQLDLLIVVDQMLTGFDSKYLNALYLDKVMEYQNIIQAFSRTNRIFNGKKPKSVGVIRYYRYPATMKFNIENAISIYSVDVKESLFVDKLPKNIETLNACYNEIKKIFRKPNGEVDFTHVPSDDASKKKFVNEFNKFSAIKSIAKVQGFSLDQIQYEDEETGEILSLEFKKEDIGALYQRYNDIKKEVENNPSPDGTRLFDIQPYAIQGESKQIDIDYLNQLFIKLNIAFKKYSPSSPEVADALEQIHGRYSLLSAEEQNFADIVIKRLEKGELEIEPGKNFMDYITEAQCNQLDITINEFVDTFGVDKDKLVELVNKPGLSEENINEGEKFNSLCKTRDDAKLAAYLSSHSGGKRFPVYQMNRILRDILKPFVLHPSDAYKEQKFE